jgi:hypothetical protein
MDHHGCSAWPLVSRWSIPVRVSMMMMTSRLPGRGGAGNWWRGGGFRVLVLVCLVDYYCAGLGITARTASSPPITGPCSVRLSLGVSQQQGKPRTRLIQRGMISRSNLNDEDAGNSWNVNESIPDFSITFSAATASSSSSWRIIQQYDTSNTMEVLTIISLAQFAEEPTDWVNLWANYPMVAPPARSAAEAQRRVTVSQVLQQGWNPADGFQTSPDETLYIQEIARRWSSPTNHHHHHHHHHHPDTYGEVTELGARQLFHQMGLTNHDENLTTSTNISTTTTATAATAASTNSAIEKEHDKISNFRLYDLGSGVGRLVAQAYMELPRVDRIVGVELGPSRHEAALTGWNLIQSNARRVRQSAAREELSLRLVDNASDDICPCRLEFHEANLFDTDVSDATHVYLASLCFTEEMMADIAQKLIREAPQLQCVATLKEFPNPLAQSLLSSSPLTPMEPLDAALLHHHPQQQRKPRVHRIEMTWTKPQGSGCVVHFYFPKRNVTCRME